MKKGIVCKYSLCHIRALFFSVGGIAGYSKAMTKFKINKTIDQISHTIANIQTLHMQQATFEGATSYIREGAELYFLIQ